MSSQVCTVKHRNNDTRARYPVCARTVRTARNGTDSAGQPSWGSPARQSLSAVPDAEGKRISVDVDNPVVKNRSLSPASVRALPTGTRFRGCTFTPGEYRMTDAVVEDCYSDRGATLIFEGVSVVSDSVLRGSVGLTGETHSSGNIYHGRTIIAETPSVSGDHFFLGYELVDGARPVIHHPTVTTGGEASALQPQQAVERSSAPKKPGVARSLGKIVGGAMVQAALNSGRHGRRGRGYGRRRRY